MSLDDVLIKYRSKGALFDSNLMLLIIIGDLDPSLIEKFKRTKKYTTSDYVLVKRIFEFFEVRVTSPNIMTEVSNLASQLWSPALADFYEVFRDKIKVIEEEYASSKEISEMQSFAKFGLTDTCIIRLVKDKYMVFSDDFPLTGKLTSLGVDAINVNNLRGTQWFGEAS